MNEGILKELCFALAKSHEEGATNYLKEMINDHQDIIKNKDSFYSKIVEMMGYIEFDDNMEITNESLLKLNFIVQLFPQLNNIEPIMTNWINLNTKEVNTTILYLVNNPIIKDSIDNFLLNNYINFINNDEIMKYIFKMDNLDIMNTFETLLNERKSLRKKIGKINDKEVIIGYDNVGFHASGFPVYKNVETKEKKDLRKKIKLLNNTIKEFIILNFKKFNFDYPLLYKILHELNDDTIWINLVIDNKLLENEYFNKIDFYIKMIDLGSFYLFNTFSMTDKSLTFEDLKNIEDEYSKKSERVYQKKYPIYNSLKNIKESYDNRVIDEYIKYMDNKIENEKNDLIEMRKRSRRILKLKLEDAKHGIHRFP